MIALETNILVLLINQDDRRQAALAERLRVFRSSADLDLQATAAPPTGATQLEEVLG
jgi:hypothetical protein